MDCLGNKYITFHMKVNKIYNLKNIVKCLENLYYKILS